jgi:putative hydrolase of HD superfamily
VVQSKRLENSAEHTWHITLMAVLLSEHANGTGLDLMRVVRMLLIHDIVEIDAGDTFGYDQAAHADKRAREQRAADRLFGLLPPDQAAEFRALWEEFESEETAEAKFALALDRLQAVMLNCALEGGSWNEHGVKLDQILARNGAIAAGSTALWTHIRKEIDALAEQGKIAR